MVDEFNLSEKIYANGFPSCDLNSKDVKEFIRRIKNMVRRQKGDVEKWKINENIDKLAGEKLCSNK